MAGCQDAENEKNTHLIEALIFGAKMEKVQAMLLEKDEMLSIDDTVRINRTEKATRK